MTALRFQIRGRRQTSPASLRGAVTQDRGQRSTVKAQQCSDHDSTFSIQHPALVTEDWAFSMRYTRLSMERVRFKLGQGIRLEGVDGLQRSALKIQDATFKLQKMNRVCVCVRACVCMCVCVCVPRLFC